MTRFNEEMTEQFKEIAKVLQEYIYCSKETISKINSLFDEKIDLESEENGSVLQKLIEKICDLRKNYSRHAISKENEIKDLNSKIKQKNEEVSILKGMMKEYEENMKSKYENDIILQKEKVFFFKNKRI